MNHLLKYNAKIILSSSIQLFETPFKAINNTCEYSVLYIGITHGNAVHFFQTYKSCQNAICEFPLGNDVPCTNNSGIHRPLQHPLSETHVIQQI